MRQRTLVVLGAVALLGAGFIFLVERNRPTTDERRSIARRLLPAFAREQVQAIRLLRAAQPAVELRREGQRWRIASPLRARAAAAAVEHLLSQLEYLQVRRLLPQQDRRMLGLAPPRVRLELRGAQRTLTLDLGRSDPSGQGLYLAQGERIFVVERALLDPELEALRDRALVAIPARSLTRIVIQRPGRELELRNDGQRWWSSGPLRVASDVAQRLTNSLSELQAVRFLAGKPVAPGSLRRIVVEGAGQRAEFYLGGACPTHADERLLFDPDEGWSCVKSTNLELLEADEAALLDPVLLDARETELAAISLGREVRLQRVGGTWQLPGGVPAEEEQVGALLERLGQYRGTVEPSGRAPVERIRLTLVREGESAPEELRFGAPQQGRVPVARGKEAALLWVREDVLAVLEVTPLRFRSRQVFSFSPEQVERLETERGGRVRRLVREAGRWRTAAVVVMLRRLGSLRALRYVDAPVAGRPTLRIKAALTREALGAADVATSHDDVELELWEKVSGGECYGRNKKGPAFILDQASCEQLAAEL